MSIAVGVTDGQTVCIGVDSYTGWEGHSRTRVDPKMLTVSGMIIACVGNMRVPQMLRAHLDVAERAPSLDPMAYMVSTVVPALNRCFSEHELGKMWNGEKAEESNGDLLVGLAGRLFVVYADSQVEESPACYNATGSASPYALGYLYRAFGKTGGGHIKGDAFGGNIVAGAMQACLEYSQDVRRPFHIWTPNRKETW